MQPVRIHKKLWYRPMTIALCLLLLALMWRTGLDEHGSIPLQYLMPAAIAFILLVYTIYATIRNTPAIVISEQGIKTQRDGSYVWEEIVSYAIYEHNDGDNTITMRLGISLKNGTEIKLPLRELNKKPEEIVAIIQQVRKDLLFLGFVEE